MASVNDALKSEERNNFGFEVFKYENSRENWHALVFVELRAGHWVRRLFDVTS